MTADIGGGDAGAGVKLRKGERKILETLARRHPVGVTPAQLGQLSGYAARGGTFRTYFGVLKRERLLQETVEGILISQAGFAYVGFDEPPAPLDQDEVLEMWRRSLRLGERRMLDELVAVYPQAMSPEHLGDRSGYEASGGTFRTYLGVLKRNGLIEIEDGVVRASETLCEL